MERLGNVRGGKFHDHRGAVSDVGLAVLAVFFQYVFHNVLDKFFFGNKHVDIRVDLFDFFKHRRVCDLFGNALGDQRRRLSHHFCELKARERVVAHFCVLRNFDHTPDLFEGQIGHLFCEQFGNFILKIYHLIVSFSVITSIP